MADFCPTVVNASNIFDGPTEIYVDNVFIGATVGGVELQLNTEYGEKVADQTPLLLGSYIKSQRGMLRFDLEELTLANLRNIFATTALNAGAGNNCIAPTHLVQLVGHGPNNTTRTFNIWKGRFSGNTTGRFELGSSVAFSVEIFMEADQAQADGQKYFSVVDA